MERECCLSMLIVLIGGSALIACGWWPAHCDLRGANARRLERIAWRRVWLPVLPAATAAIWLCGWALVEPDPVPERVPISLIVISVPFGMLFARAAIRAGWALVADGGATGTATVGLLQPWIVFSPHLAKALDNQQVEAALAHERAHVRHRDPLRIWLAQLATDLQWPWPQASERMRRWLLALELARDEEARAAGVDGTDLADAILASARYGHQVALSAQAALIGDQSALKERIRRLLDPLSDDAQAKRRSPYGALLALMPAMLLVLALGSIFGERVVPVLFRIAS
jgi:hypothetical protein